MPGITCYSKETAHVVKRYSLTASTITHGSLLIQRGMALRLLTPGPP